METNIHAHSTNFIDLPNGGVFVADQQNNRYLGIKVDDINEGYKDRYVIQLMKAQHNGSSYLNTLSFRNPYNFTVLSLNNVTLDLCLDNAIFRYPANEKCGRILLISNAPYLYINDGLLINLNNYEIHRDKVVNAIAFDQWRLVQNTDSKEIEVYSYSSE